MSRQDDLQEVNLLDLAPERVAEWEEVGDRVILLRPPPKGRGLRLLVEWVTHQMAARRIRLDEVGTFVWKRLDGRTSVGRLVDALEEEFGEPVQPAAERLGRLIRMLRKENLVRYPGIDRPD